MTMAAVMSRMQLRNEPIRSQEPEEDSFCFNSLSYIRKETDYLRKIRLGLEQIQVNIVNKADAFRRGKAESKCSVRSPGSLGPQHQQVLEDLKAKELQLSHILMENQELELRLEVSREAGATVMRDATRRIFFLHEHQAEEQRERHGKEKQALQNDLMEQDENLKTAMVNFNNLERRLLEKQEKVTELERLLEKMEQERTALETKKNVIEHEARCKLSVPHKSGSDGESMRRHKMELCTLAEKAGHLDHMILSQNRTLRSYLQHIAHLKMEQSAKDGVLKSLAERMYSAQAQNKQMKDRFEFHISQAPKKVSQGVSVSFPSQGTRYPPLKGLMSEIT